MIRLGLCSGACITRDVKGVLALARAARIEGVEWTADAPSHADDLPAASQAMIATLEAGLATVSFATLYRAGVEDSGFARFDALLNVASAMQAPIMRLFARAGVKDGTRSPLAEELRQLGDRAARKGITLCLSLGRGTSLDRYDRAVSLVAAVDHDFVRLAWEDLPGASAKEATAALEEAGALAGLVVARCADRSGTPRPIAGDEGHWLERIRAFRRAAPDPGMSSFLLLASARPEGKAGEDSLIADANALRAIIAEVESSKS